MSQLLPTRMLNELIDQFALNLFLTQWPKDASMPAILEEVRTNAGTPYDINIEAPVIANFIEKARQDAHALISEIERVREQEVPKVTHIVLMESKTTYGRDSETFTPLPNETLHEAASRIAYSYGARVISVTTTYVSQETPVAA